MSEDIERMLSDYLEDKQLFKHQPFVIEVMFIREDCIHFHEISHANEYLKRHKVLMLNLIVWLHNNTEELENRNLENFAAKFDARVKALEEQVKNYDKS
jgi:hypothetical protein